jgi:hypothetical protein
MQKSFSDDERTSVTVLILLFYISSYGPPRPQQHPPNLSMTADLVDPVGPGANKAGFLQIPALLYRLYFY